MEPETLCQKPSEVSDPPCQKPPISAARLAANRRNIALSAGRPRLRVDSAKLERLLRDRAFGEDAARQLGVSRSTYQRRKRDLRRELESW